MIPDMDIASLYEYPLPVLNTSIDKIEAEASGDVEGEFLIKNKGGGELKGKILSNSKAVRFAPEDFSGRTVNITYTLRLSLYKPGDVIRTSAVIMSNGGEQTLPVVMKIIPACIETDEGVIITEMADFANYAANYPQAARRLLISKEFAKWLGAIKYPYLDSFETFLTDSDRERALDNILIISGLKAKAGIYPMVKSLVALTNPYDRSPYSGEIPVKRTETGYINEEIKLKNKVKWLKLGKERILSQDFDAAGRLSLSFFINPALMPGRVCLEKAYIGGGEVSFIAKKLPPVTARLSRESFGFEDSGIIFLSNNTGKDVMIDITPEDISLKFEGRRYYIGKYAEIPFEVKLSALQSAQLGLRKQPVIPTGIILRARDEFVNYNQRLPLSIGQLYIN